MQLPYANSTADPAKAQKRIRTALLKFGVGRISFDEDFESQVLTINFRYEKYPVSLPVDYGKLAELYMEDAPYSSRSRKTKEAWVAGKLDTAYRASFSLLDDFIKALITMVVTGLCSFEEAFVSRFVSPDGERLGDLLAPKLSQFIDGQIALGSGS